MEQITIHHEQYIREQVNEPISKSFTIEENASLKALFIVENTNCIIDIHCAGKNSKAEVTCLFLSKNSEKISAKVFGHLEADGAAAEIYLLSFLGDHADCQVDGGVNIAKDTKGASGHLLEENIVLGKKVKVKTLPMLDVRSSDVSASHGAKIDRLDESKLFYMMAKGLDQKQAQRLIVQGYIERAWERVSRDTENEQKEQVVSHILDYFAMNG